MVDVDFRIQDQCVMGVHKETGKMFGGKASGTCVGYTKKQYLKAAMKHAHVDHKDYYFVSVNFTDILHIPTITMDVNEEENKNGREK